jgi:hypothetical protein
MQRFVALAGSLILGLMVSTQLVAQTQDETQDRAFMQTFHTISSNELMAYAEEMSSDRYRGRLSGTPEYLQVAEWVASLLHEWGIEPGGDNGTYLQTFDMPYSDVKSAGALSVEMQSGGESLHIDYSFPGDYYPGTNSDAGTVTGEIVYVGYGITAPELGYDDYAGIDVAGKIVVIDAGVPFEGDEETFVRWVPYSYHQKKLNTARSHGAAGLLYASKIANPNTSFNAGFIYCHIDNHVADPLAEYVGSQFQHLFRAILHSGN